MKLNKLFMGFLGALALTACSSEDVVTPNNGSGNGPNSDDSRFMSITIRNTEMGTRGPGDQAGNTYEEGLDLENDVKNIRFYFFGDNGVPFGVNENGNYVDITEGIEEDGIDMPNVEQTFKAIIVFNKQEADFANLKSMVAVVNCDNDALGSGSKTLASLRQIVGDYSVAGMFNNKSTDIPKMLMTSSVFGSSNNYEGCEVYINPTKLKTERADAEADPVDVYVERVVAKVRMTAKWDSSVTTQEVDGSVLVQLNDQKTNNPITLADGSKIYAKFIGWGIQTYTDKSYLFKHIGGDYTAPTWNNMTAWDSNLGNWWNDPANYRSYWAVNPDNVEYKHAKHTDAKGRIATKLTTTEGNVTTTKEYDGDFFYVQENAGDNNNGLKTKDDYDPDNAISARTQAYIRANLVDATGKAIHLVEWGGSKYTDDGAKSLMWNAIKDRIHIAKTVKKETVEDTENGGTQTEITTTTEWQEIPFEMIAFAKAEEIGKADSNSENSKRYLSYIQLGKNYKDYFIEGDDEHKFYKADNKTELSVAEVNQILSDMPGAKVWESGETYYYTDLAHLMYDATKQEQPYLTKGAYGVVRNHIYEVELNKIFGLGTPVMDPNMGSDSEKVIIPQKPTPDAFFLGARMNILSWRVVSNKTDLNW